VRRHLPRRRRPAAVFGAACGDGAAFLEGLRGKVARASPRRQRGFARPSLTALRKGASARGVWMTAARDRGRSRSALFLGQQDRQGVAGKREFKNQDLTPFLMVS